MTGDEPHPITPDDAIATLLGALSEIRETMPRCAGCENFLSVVARVHDELDEVVTGEVAPPGSAAARERLGAWLAAAEGRVRTTNHCEVCVPSGPYERYRAALGRPGETPGSAK